MNLKEKSKLKKTRYQSMSSMSLKLIFNPILFKVIQTVEQSKLL